MKLFNCSHKFLAGQCKVDKCLCEQIHSAIDTPALCACGHSSFMHAIAPNECQCNFFSGGQDESVCLCGHLNIYHVVYSEANAPFVRDATLYRSDEDEAVHQVLDVNSIAMLTSSTQNNLIGSTDNLFSNKRRRLLEG